MPTIYCTQCEATGYYHNFRGSKVSEMRCEKCNSVMSGRPRNWKSWTCDISDRNPEKFSHGNCQARGCKCECHAKPKHVALQVTKEKVMEHISSLSVREQKILTMRFGLDDSVPHTLEEVGKEFGITRERVRQIEAKCIERIKDYLQLKKL